MSRCLAPQPAGARAGGVAERLVGLPVVGRVVDDDVPDAQGVQVAEGALEASCVHGRLQPEVGVVDDGERLVVVGHGDERDNRPERLVAVDEGVDTDAVHDRRLVVELRRPPGVARAADHDLRPLRHSVLQVGVHLLRRRLVVRGASPAAVSSISATASARKGFPCSSKSSPCELLRPRVERVRDPVADHGAVPGGACPPTSAAPRAPPRPPEPRPPCSRSGPPRSSRPTPGRRSRARPRRSRRPTHRR